MSSAISPECITKQGYRIWCFHVLSTPGEHERVSHRNSCSNSVRTAEQLYRTHRTSQLSVMLPCAANLMQTLFQSWPFQKKKKKKPTDQMIQHSFPISSSSSTFLGSFWLDMVLNKWGGIKSIKKNNVSFATAVSSQWGQQPSGTNEKWGPFPPSCEVKPAAVLQRPGKCYRCFSCLLMTKVLKRWPHWYLP